MKLVMRTFRARFGMERRVARCLAGLASTVVRRGGARGALVFGSVSDRRRFVSLEEYGVSAGVQERDSLSAYLSSLEDSVVVPSTARTLVLVSAVDAASCRAHRLWIVELGLIGGEVSGVGLSSSGVVGWALHRTLDSYAYTALLGLAGAVTPRDVLPKSLPVAIVDGGFSLIVDASRWSSGSDDASPAIRTARWIHEAEARRSYDALVCG